MTPRRHILWLGAILAIVGIWIGYYWSQTREASTTRRQADSFTEDSSFQSAAIESQEVNDNSPGGMLARVFGRLRSGDLRPGDLNALRNAILSAPKAESIAAILKFLATGQDATTGESFAVGTRGELSGAPTFRVLLLDLLGRVCRENRSDEGLVYSRKLLEHKTSADEWAIAMRNTAWAAPKDIGYLERKAREMLNYQPWRQQPSAGFREAFDVFVYSRSVSSIPDLANMLSGEDASLQTSAAVALDRLAERAPLDAMNFLNQNREQLSNKPFLRADYFSKADLSQPAQRLAVETYLARPDVQIQEKVKLLAVFASPGSFAADSLLTELPPEEFPPERTAALRQAVGDWLSTGRYIELTTALRQLERQIAN